MLVTKTGILCWMTLFDLALHSTLVAAFHTGILHLGLKALIYQPYAGQETAHGCFQTGLSVYQYKPLRSH